MAEKRRQLTQAQLADYDQLCHDRTYGRILTPDGLRFICEANNYDAEAIGRHFLDVLQRFNANITNKRHTAHEET